MKKIALLLALLFFLASISVASAAPVRNVYIRELCRNGPVIAYGMYDVNTNSRITTLDARGYLDLTEKIKNYEQQNEVKLLWNYYTNKRTGPESGVFIGDC